MFFNQPKRRITELELKKIKQTLHDTLDANEWTEVEMLFRGDLDEPGTERGIDKKECEKGLTWLKQNRSRHHLGDEELKSLEEAFAEHLKD